MSDLVVGTDVVKDYQERVKDLERRLSEAHMTAERAGDDGSILLPLAQEFITRALERGDHDAIRGALQAIIKDTGIEPDDIAESLHRQGVLSGASEYMNRRFIVSVTVPVMLTIEVDAVDYSTAEDIASECLYNDGIDSYSYDTDYYNAEYYVEEG